MLQYFAKAGRHDIISVMKEQTEKIHFKPIEEKNKELAGWLLVIVSFLLYLFCISQGFTNDIWYDEVFSVRFSGLSYGEIAAATAKDVHPPFYYWYLKFVADAIHLIFPGLHFFTACKIASMIPVLGIYFYALRFVRKRFGTATAGIFLFFITGMPQIFNYTVEIRMYSLALFFVTAFFIHSLEIVYEERMKDYLFLFLYGILTAYTQYFSCVAVIGIYISLLVYQSVLKKWPAVKKTLFSIGLSVLCYLPWLPSLFGQISAVRSGYWIQPFTLRTVPGCFKYVFLPVSYDGILNYAAAVLTILTVAAALFMFFRKKGNREELYFVLTAFLVPVCIAAVGLVCSLTGRPIFVYRYLIPALGVFWLAVAFLFAVQWRTGAVCLLFLPFLLTAFLNMKGFCMEEHKKNTEMVKTGELISEFPENAVIVANFDHVQAVTACYLENDSYLYGGEPYPLIRELLPQCKTVQAVEDGDALTELVRNEDVYFFGSFEVREELLKQWQKLGIGYTEEGSYLLERYWFNVYHLEWMNGESE